MWVEKVTTKNGIRYKYAEQYIDNMTGKKKRVSVTLEKNNRAARKMAAEALSRKNWPRWSMRFRKSAGGCSLAFWRCPACDLVKLLH